MELLQNCAKPSKCAISFHPPFGYWNTNIPLIDARIYSEYSRMLINRKNIWWRCHSQLSWHHDNSCFSVQPRWRKKMHWNLNSQKTPHTSPSGDLWDVFLNILEKNDCYNNSRPANWNGLGKWGCHVYIPICFAVTQYVSMNLFFPFSNNIFNISFLFSEVN